MRAGALQVAGRHRDGGPGTAERAGRLEAEPGVTSRHDDVLAAHVDAGDDVGGSGGGQEPASDRMLHGRHR